MKTVNCSFPLCTQMSLTVNGVKTDYPKLVEVPKEYNGPAYCSKECEKNHKEMIRSNSTF